MIETDNSARIHTVSTLTRQRRWKPLYVVTGEKDNRFYAAKWKLPAHRIVSECVVDHMLIYRLDGATYASKIIDGKTIRKPSQPGTVTLIPSGEQALYAVEDPSTYLELYIPPTLIRQYAEEHVRGAALSIRPLFAVEDTWLSGYFQMLKSEIEMYMATSAEPDILLLEQAQQLLLRHLLRAYSGATPDKLQALEQPKRGRRLRPHLLKRVTDHISANLGTEVYLKDLAALANLSETHFIRAFHAATGRTPYQYILEERLRVCAELLRADNEMPVAEIAKSMGFKSASHFAMTFKTKYGVTPSDYRHH